jgi:hypothetical protein
MPSPNNYRLYTMDRGGHIVDVRPLKARSDLAAMVVADSADAELHELWCGDRQITGFSALRTITDGGVHSIEPADDPSSSDGLAGQDVPLPAPELIRRIQTARRARSTFLPTELFADAAWDMLLELFACELEQTRLSVGSLSSASGVPPTVALRWIRSLQDHGLACRLNDRNDDTGQSVSLSSMGSAAMRSYFAGVSSAFMAI